MSRLRLIVATIIAIGIIAALAAPAIADPLPCKIFIRSTYVANNPLCYIQR